MSIDTVSFDGETEDFEHYEINSTITWEVKNPGKVARARNNKYYSDGWDKE